LRGGGLRVCADATTEQNTDNTEHRTSAIA